MKWLLAIPQYILVGAFVASGYVVAISVQDSHVIRYSTLSLIGACVLIAAIGMLLLRVTRLAFLAWHLESIGGVTGCWFMWR